MTISIESVAHILVACLLFFAGATHADPATDDTLVSPPLYAKPAVQKRSRKHVQKPKTSVDRHFFASLFYNSANQVKYKGNTSLFGTPTPFTATESTNSALGLAGGYMSRRANGLGYSGEVAFEFVRHSNGITGTAGNATVSGSYVGNSGTNIWSSMVNGNYSFGTDFYLFMGPNYPLTFLNKGTDNLQGLLGYQGGLGYAVSNTLTIEAGYKVLRMKGNIDVPGTPLQIDEATLPGFIIGLQYLF